MPPIQPRPPRWRSETTPAGLRITIPARRAWPMLVGLILWLVAWAAGEIYSLLPFILVGEQMLMGAFYFIPWLVFWTAAGVGSLYALLWVVGGREVITIDSDSLTIRREILGIGRSRAYTLSHVGDWQFIPWQAAPSFWNAHGGSILFDYGSDTIRFGLSLTGREATQLGQVIRRQIENARAPATPPSSDGA